MKTFPFSISLVGLYVLLALAGCGTPTEQPAHQTFSFSPSADSETQIQEAMILMNDGDTIALAEGLFEFTNTLSIDDKNGIVIKGAGIDKTTLAFSGQDAGAEGLKISGEQVLLVDFTVRDAKGDAIKVKDTDGITFLRIGTVWSGEPKPENGAYGLYPVGCSNVLVDGCYAYGASDAGIYIGQSRGVIVRNTVAERNVAGIEIENCFDADVYDCVAKHNTGGILVFDMPGIPVKNGRNCRVFRNKIIENDQPNFAPPGNFVGITPPGSGMLIMTSKGVEIFENEIINNNTSGINIVSYKSLEALDANITLKDPEYNPFVADIYIHDNLISRTNETPENQTQLGELIISLFPGGNIPDILFDGLQNPALSSMAEMGICIRNNGDARFVNLDVANGFKKMDMDASPYDCEGIRLAEVSINAPML